MFLCYNTPAQMNYVGWENEALPLGNGKIGAKVFGGANCELIAFNEKTLWSGGKDCANWNAGISNPDEGKAIKEIQKLLADGKQKEATAMMKKLEGNHNGFGSYQSFGSLYLNFGKQNANENYVRDLDLDSASSMVTYKIGKATFTRHYFVSYPDNVFVARLESEGEKNDFSFDAYFVSDQNAKCESKDGTIFMSGTVNDNDGLGKPDGDGKNNMKHACFFKFIAKDGTVQAAEDGHVEVKDTTSVVIIGSLATDYINRYPDYCDGSDPLEKAKHCVLKASKKTFGELYRTHLEDYRELFNRVTFTLGESESGQTTDYMLNRFSKRGEYKRNLITTLFQYGRYLLIASSRDGSLPANLQGIWNAKNNPPWECDYHLNINLQINYWPVYAANISETALPLIDFVNSLREPGRVVAQKTMGIGKKKAVGEADYKKPTGWVAHTMVTPLGMVAPGYDWRWGWAPVNGAWITQNTFEYFLYSRDYKKLNDEIYPAMEEAALLWSQLLIEDKNTGRLVVSPCFSPEHGPVSAGGTFEQSIVYNLFENVVYASEELCKNGFEKSVNKELIEKIKTQKDLIKPYAIGKNAQLKEWEDEDSFSFMDRKKLSIQKKHRHLSHLLGVYPFNHIKKEDHILSKGAFVSLLERGFKTTGWALSHRLVCYARLLNAQRCDIVVDRILKTMILKNLFGNHPPFQIDCNFGFTAGVCEMLLQSHEDFIRLLPALPEEWHEGSFSGLMARGNVEIGLTWQDHKMKKGTVKSNLGGICKLYYDGKIILVYDEDGNEIETEYDGKGITSFNAEKGKTYTIK